MKRLLIRAAVIAGIIAAFILLWRAYRAETRERRRLEANQRTLLTDVEYYRTRDSLSAAGVERLTLTNREFRRHAQELERTVEDLQLKVRRLQSASRTAVTTQYPVEVRLRDTVVVRDTLRESGISGLSDTLRRLYYINPWLTLDGTISADSLFRGRIESRDTLIQVVHRVPRRFWFIRWGTKAIRQEVTTRNPYSRITYTEYIELKRRKRKL